MARAENVGSTTSLSTTGKSKQKGESFLGNNGFMTYNCFHIGSLRDQRESHHHRFVKRRQSGVSGSSAVSAPGAGALLGSGARREESSDDEVVSVYKT